MIKAVIIDADTPLSGEIVRLLVNHPDVEITGLVSAEHIGEEASVLHRGLVGEQILRFRRDMPNDADVIFLCGSNGREKATRLLFESKTKVIDISRQSYIASTSINAVPAISEIFRKPLVRGAREAQVLSPLETLLLISLYPLARHLLLSSALQVNVFTSEAIAADLDAARAGEISAHLLQSIQQSFDHDVTFNIATNAVNERGIMISTCIRLAMPVRDLVPFYEEVYDDHNFTFLTPDVCEMREVIGTNKCLIHLERSDADLLTITAVADGRMRGWAGEAVLAMNLMFGLYERIGLQLKASEY